MSVGARRPYGMRSDRRAAARQQTRESLLQAGCAVILDGGPGQLTAERIASTAGVSRATLYLHFTSADDLVGELRATMIQHFDDCYGKLASLATLDTEATAAWLNDVLLMCRSNRPRLLALMLTGASRTEAFDAHRYYLTVIGRLGATMPAFAAAQVDGIAKARALLLLMQVEAIIRYCVAVDMGVPTADLVKVVARDLADFVASVA